MLIKWKCSKWRRVHAFDVKKLSRKIKADERKVSIRRCYRLVITDRCCQSISVVFEMLDFFQAEKIVIIGRFIGR